MTVYRVLTTYLEGEPLNVGDLVEVHVPGREIRWGKWAGLTQTGYARVNLWSVFGGYCHGSTTYSTSFIRRLHR